MRITTRPTSSRWWWHGRATLGTHAVAPVTVHFAGAYTAYGPIRASEHGVHYFTLRNGFDPGARFMERAEHRAALRTVPGRRHWEAVAGPADAPGSPDTVALLPGGADGLGAWRYRLGPGERLAGPPTETGAGQYWLVLSGALLQDDAAYGRLSCGFACPGDGRFTGQAGPQGLDVVAMQFPKRSG